MKFKIYNILLYKKIYLVSLISIFPDIIFYSYIGFSYLFYHLLIKNDLYDSLFIFAQLNSGIPLAISVLSYFFTKNGFLTVIIFYFSRLLIALETGIVTFYLNQKYSFIKSILITLGLNFIFSSVAALIVFFNLNIGPAD